MTARRRLLPSLAAVVVLAAAVVVVASTLRTSSARVAATTETSSFISAGSVELDQPNSRVDLLFDADGLYPGLDVVGCVDVEYRGSLPASVRLHSSPSGGDGLEAHVDFRVDVLRGGCDGRGSVRAFDGLLAELFESHGDYGDGATLQPAMTAGERIGVRAVASLRDTNDAQGLTVDFALSIEARP